MTVTNPHAVAPRPPADVILATGELATVRPVVPSDEAGLRGLYERATPESLRLRFFGYSRVAVDRDIARMLRPPSSEHLAFVATTHDKVIGMGCVAATRRSGIGDIALLVDDTRHGQGVGMLLVEHLVAASRRAGFRRIRADVLADNTPMLRVFKHLGAGTVKHLDYGVIDIEFRLTPDEIWQQAIERREAIADHASIDRILAPRSVVVVGAGHRETAIGHRLLKSILSGAFTGDLYAVNRDGEPVAEVPATRSVDELPIAPDLAIVAVPALDVLDVVCDCADAGIRGAVIISDGFAELGDQGKALQRELLATARAAGMRLIGPNCLGVVNTDPGIRLNATFADLQPLAGRIGVASQSGGVGLAMIDHLNQRGIGISTFVSLGNKADVSGNDLLMFWERDQATNICLLYLESFGNARKFARIAARVARSKPIVAITAGRTDAGARGVRSHTAAAATPAVALDALFGQAGVIQAGSMGEAMDIVALLDRAPLPRGRRVAVVTNGGGPGALAADAAIAASLELPELSSPLQRELRQALPAHAATANPVDTTAGGSVEILASTTGVLLGSDEVDAVMLVHTSLSRDETGRLVDALSVPLHDHPDKPLLAVFIGKPASETSESELAAFDFPEPAARALAAVARYAEWRERPSVRAPALRSVRRRTAERLVQSYLSAHPDGGWLDTDVAAELISTYGIAVASTLRADTPEEAVTAAHALTYPVAVKSGSGSVLHRTEKGAVRLGISSDDELREAVSTITAACGDGPVVIQPMLESGIETAIGVVNDPSVGPIVMLALGGVATDLMADRSFRLPPIGRAEANAMIRSLHAAPLLFGYRGSALVDVAALEDLILRVGRLAIDLPELADLDLNPVLVTATGAVAVDVKIRLRAAPVEDSTLRQLPALPRAVVGPNR